MHFVDISIIVAFLVATLYIGFSSGKKIKTFSDYAIGNRNFSDFAICCTICATIIGGVATMGNIGKVYDVGIVHLFAEIGKPIGFIIVGAFLAFRFGNYYGCCSLGDMFFKPYGISGKVLVGIIGALYGMIGIGSQFIALGTVISVLTKFSYATSLLIGAGIILIYTGRGGIRAVTFTDVLQFIVLILALPILAMVVVNKIGGIHALFEQLPKTHVTISPENLHRYMFLILPMIMPTLSPFHTQRLLMTSNRAQGVKAYYNMSWVFLFVVIMGVFLGLAAKVLFPGLPRGDQALLTLITNYLPVGIFGMAVIGILAVLMSTADSYLNGCSILIVNDVLIPYNEYIKNRKLLEEKKLKLARSCSLFIGIGGILFAYFHMGLFETRILVSTLWFSVILPSLYFLLFNMKVSLKGLFVSGTVGFLTATLWAAYIKPITNIDGLFPGFFANVITIIFFYFLGGRQKVFSKEELERKRLLEKVQSQKRPCVRDLQNRNNVYLGLCLVFLQLMPLLLGTRALTNSKLLLIFINGVMAILLIFGSSLEIFTQEKRFQWLKLITLFVCLPVTSSYHLLTSSENGLHILTLAMSFVVMLLTVETKNSWKMVITCILTVVATLFLFEKNNCTLCWPKMLVWQHCFYVFGYLTVLLLLRFNLVTLQQEEKREKELAAYHERYMMARSLSHDLCLPLTTLHALVDLRKHGVFDKQEYYTMKTTLNELKSYVEDFLVDYLEGNMSLKRIDLNACILSCIDKQKILNRRIDIQLQATETVFATVDPVLFRRIINNLLSICIRALPNDCKLLTIQLQNDPPYDVCGLLIKPDKGIFSAKNLQDMFIKNQILDDKVEIGISFQEFQAIIAKWKGKLNLITQGDKAFFQIILSTKKRKSREQSEKVSLLRKIDENK